MSFNRGVFSPMRRPGIEANNSVRRRAWLTTAPVSATLMGMKDRFIGLIPGGARQVAEYEKVVPKSGNDLVAIQLVDAVKRYCEIYLTDMTEDELLAFRDFVTSACMQALPIVREKDRIAEEVYREHGTTAFDRVGRLVPELHFRYGEIERYREGIRLGSEVPLGVGWAGHFTSRARGHSGDVAERDSAGREPGDHQPTPDGDPGIRQVGGPDHLPF